MNPKSSEISNVNPSARFKSPLKYKPRSVSAHRDFPPGCGRNSPPITNLKFHETLPTEKTEVPDNSVAMEIPVNGVQENGTGACDKEGKSSSKEISASCELENGIEAINSKVEDILRIENSSLEIDFLVEKIVAPKVDHQAIVSLSVEGNASLTPNVPNEDEIPQTLTKQTFATEETNVQEIGSVANKVVQSVNINDNDQKETISRLKYKRREKSAHRDFPPFCGRNAPSPSEIDLQETEVRNADVKETTELKVEVKRSFEEINEEVLLGNKEGSSNDNITNTSSVDDVTEYNHEEENKEVVHALMAAPNCPWRNRTLGSASKVSDRNDSSARKSKKKKLTSEKGELEGHQESPSSLNVSKKTLPRCSPNVSNQGDARNKVRETLRFFQATCRKMLQEEEANPEMARNLKRVDLRAANFVKEKKMVANKGFCNVGSVPGVEIGDEFQYRVELALVGIHRPYQNGIDVMKKDKETNIATSIVASGGYADCLDNPDVLVYSGQGGLTAGKNKEPTDQKIERGNKALVNSMSSKNAVRVIHGTKETTKSDVKTKLTTTYTYDGLYIVERYWHETGANGKLTYKFQLNRIPGQPPVAWKEVKQIKKFSVREGLCNADISLGKELFPICAVNIVDDEKPPSFTYITKMHYPDSYKPVPQKGCECIGGCADYDNCTCVVKNGGEIPFNHNGAIVETKCLVYECGPSCKCPPSCPNRVSQHGLKIQLEIFKTPTRGWGVRSLTSISSGTFICEYIGELIEDKEAENRKNDEYLFDIGQNYAHSFPKEETDNNKNVLDVSGCSKKEDDGYTIDAAEFGNIGRFINHSCSPNLYAQNVLYDHEDKKMPHIMLFAAEHIPPLKELTYHYNYTVDSVYDSNGNIKKKNCYCGSLECTGRMY